ncbi:nitrate reductase [Bradyrhizobium sp. McL0615]|uniref:nitrate reductase n=1 Tax=Bradyrhizobium sp. McL0615 TaxID=3415673 RepID=UPI003CFAD094
MSDTSNRHDAQPAPEAELATGRRAELVVFAIIAAFIWPVVAVGVVGGYGFLVWASQMILGPPGPPGG